MCSTVVNRPGGYKLGNTLVGQLWLIISGHVMEKFQFHYSVAYSAPVECKTGNNTEIIGNPKEKKGSFWGIKEYNKAIVTNFIVSGHELFKSFMGAGGTF